MKKIAYLFSAALLAGSLVSCDLDSMSMTEKDTSNFPVNADDAAQALAGIYQNLNAVNANPQETWHYYALLASDDQYGGGGTNDKLMQAMDLILNYNTNMTRDFWQQRYQGINRANTLIDALATVDFDATQKAQTKGEALFMRAFFYYELASMYGRVPLMVTAAAPEDNTPPAASVIWGQILQDLRDACDIMPAQRNSDGHVDKYCAEALLGRCWLFYTGFYCNGEEVKDLVNTNYSPLTSVQLPDGTTLTKEQVIGYIDDCVNNSGYKLVDDFRNLWAYTNRCTVEDYSYTSGQGLKWVEDDNGVNPESMFAVKFNKMASWQTTIGYANGYSLHFGVRGGQAYGNTFPFGQGWGAGPVATNLVTDWKNAEPRDMRFDATILNVNDLPAYTKGGWEDFVQETDYYGKKLSPITSKKKDGSGDYYCTFENEMYPGGWEVSGEENFQLGNIHDMVLIRFAEVLLMQSELKESVDGINKVRARAGLASIPSYSLEALQKERRWELAFEGLRFNDIRRWHIAANALEKQTNQDCYYCGRASSNFAHNGGYAARYNATAGFQKYPEAEVVLSEGSLTQNAGWTDSSSEYSDWNNY